MTTHGHLQRGFLLGELEENEVGDAHGHQVPTLRVQEELLDGKGVVLAVRLLALGLVKDLGCLELVEDL